MEAREAVAAYIAALGLHTQLSGSDIDAIATESTSSSSPSPGSLPSLLTGGASAGDLPSIISNEVTSDSVPSLPESLDVSEDTMNTDALLPYYLAGYRGGGGEEGSVSFSPSLFSGIGSPMRTPMTKWEPAASPQQKRARETAPEAGGGGGGEGSAAALAALQAQLAAVEAKALEQQEDLTDLTNTCVRIRLENARLEEQLRSVEEAEAVKHDLVTLQIENARLRDASEAVAQERQQFERTIKLQSALDACQAELQHVRGERDRLADLNDALISEKQSKHTQLLKAQAELDGMSGQCDALRADITQLRHALDVSANAGPAKDLQVLRLRDEADTLHAQLVTANNEQRQLEVRLELQHSRLQEALADTQRWRGEVERALTTVAGKEERIGQLEELLLAANRDKAQLQDDLHRVLSRRGDLAALRVLVEQQALAPPVPAPAPPPPAPSPSPPHTYAHTRSVGNSPVMWSPRLPPPVHSHSPLQPTILPGVNLSGYTSRVVEAVVMSPPRGDDVMGLVDVTEGSQFPKWYKRLRQPAPLAK